MEYLPTFTINLGQMQANIPYVEHLGKGNDYTMVEPTCHTVGGRNPAQVEVGSWHPCHKRPGVSVHSKWCATIGICGIFMTFCAWQLSQSHPT